VCLHQMKVANLNGNEYVDCSGNIDVCGSTIKS